MPSINCRRAQTGGRPALAPLGNNGSSTAHCSSVRSPRPMNRDHPQPKIHFRAHNGPPPPRPGWLRRAGPAAARWPPSARTSGFPCLEAGDQTLRVFRPGNRLVARPCPAASAAGGYTIGRCAGGGSPPRSTYGSRGARPPAGNRLLSHRPVGITYCVQQPHVLRYSRRPDQHCTCSDAASAGSGVLCLALQCARAG